MDNEPEMGSIKTRFRKLIRVASLRRLAVGELGQWIVSVAPAMPTVFLLILANNVSTYKYLVVAEIILFSFLGIFFVLGSRARIWKPVVWFTIIVAWIPTVQIFLMLRRVFPEALCVLPFLFGFVFLSYLFQKQGLRFGFKVVMPLASVIFIACIIYNVEYISLIAMLFGVFSVGAMVAFIEHYGSRKSFPILYVPIYLPCVAILILYYSLALNLYTTRSSADPVEIARHPGIERMDGEDNAPPPSEDINFILCGDSTCTEFKNMIPDPLTWIDQNGHRHKIDFRGKISDEAVVNRDRGAYYFFANKELYEYQPLNGYVRTVTSLESAYNQLIPFQESGNIREFPREKANRLLIQFDNARGLAVYNVESGTTKVIPMKMRHTDSIWNADGSKIVTLALRDIGYSFSEGRLYLLDDSGAILRERNIRTAMAYLTQTDQDYFFIGYYFENKVEKVSYETLETIATIEVDVSPRAMYFLSKWHCLIVPSFAKGTLRLVNTESLEVSDPIQIGQRVRAIVPAMEPDRYFISSVSGSFALNFPQLANGWKGMVTWNGGTNANIEYQ